MSLTLWNRMRTAARGSCDQFHLNTISGPSISECEWVCVSKWMYSMRIDWLPARCRVYTSRLHLPQLFTFFAGFELLRCLSPAPHNFYICMNKQQQQQQNKYINKWIFCLVTPPAPRSPAHLAICLWLVSWKKKRDWKWKCLPGSTSWRLSRSSMRYLSLSLSLYHSFCLSSTAFYLVFFLRNTLRSKQSDRLDWNRFN